MSGAIERKGGTGISIYGSEKAVFSIPNVSEGKLEEILGFLHENFKKAENKIEGTLYEGFLGGFSYEEPKYDNDKKRIVNPSSALDLDELMTYSSNKKIFILSEFLFDSEVLVCPISGKKVLKIIESEDSPAITDGIYKTIATLNGARKEELSKESDLILTVKSHIDGIPFDPTFIYDAGKKYGKLT